MNWKHSIAKEVVIASSTLIWANPKFLVYVAKKYNGGRKRPAYYQGTYLEEKPFSMRTLTRESGTFLLSCLRISERGLLIPELTTTSSSSSGSASLNLDSDEEEEEAPFA